MPDVIVIGGGVIGLSIAWELSRHGSTVRILEQGFIGQEASWAGAGMLPPANLACAESPLARLRGAAHEMWPDWSEELRSATGLDNEFRRCGGVEVRLDGRTDALSEFDDEIVRMRAEGITIETDDLAEIRRLIPALGREVAAAYLMPDFCQVRNPRHLKALQMACTSRGVELRTGAPVARIQSNGSRVISVDTPTESHEASEFVFASGAWSSELLRQLGLILPIEPIKGQIVLLQTDTVMFRHVIQIGREYLVPRMDGHVLVGSTEERAGFDKRTTAEAFEALICLARKLVPGLGQTRVERTWAGLRPHAVQGRPYIGRLPRYVNASVAAGHFREGLHLSPITAVLIRQLLLNQAVQFPDACQISES